MIDFVPSNSSKSSSVSWTVALFGSDIVALYKSGRIRIDRDARS